MARHGRNKRKARCAVRPVIEALASKWRNNAISPSELQLRGSVSTRIVAASVPGDAPQLQPQLGPADRDSGHAERETEQAQRYDQHGAQIRAAGQGRKF